MPLRLPEQGEIWLRYDDVEVEIVLRSSDRTGGYVRVRAEGSNRDVRVGLEQFTRGGARAWRYLRDA